MEKYAFFSELDDLLKFVKFGGKKTEGDKLIRFKITRAKVKSVKSKLPLKKE
jgi:hypothetical protein